MNPERSKELVLMNLRRQNMDYQKRATDALIHAEDAIKKKDIQHAKQLINEIVFCEKSKSGPRYNGTSEIQLMAILLTDFFAHEDPSKIQLFFNIFEPGKSSRKLLMLKFILTAIAIQSPVALNAAGAYLLDPQTKDFRIATDFGRLLTNEILFFANNSIEKLKNLATLSPLFANSLCLIFAETFKEDQLPNSVIGCLVTEFMQSTGPPLIYTFALPSHSEVGALVLGAIFRWTVLSEIYEERPSYSRLHLKILECLAGIDPSVAGKPIVYTKYLENVVDLVQKATKVKDPERVQRSLEKFAQLIQASKPFWYGSLQFIEKLKALPKNPLLELVLTTVK